MPVSFWLHLKSLRIASYCMWKLGQLAPIVLEDTSEGKWCRGKLKIRWMYDIKHW